MKEFIKEYKMFVLIFCIIVLVIILTYTYDYKTWNDGYCQCGGKWEYIQSINTVYGGKNSIQTHTTYIYKCDKCGSMHEFNILR